MLSRRRSRHQIGACCVGSLGCYALGTRANPPKTAEHLGHIAACQFDQYDISWAYGVSGFDNLCGLRIPIQQFSQCICLEG